MDPAAAALPRSIRRVICVFQYPDGREFGRVAFPRKVFARIQRAASGMGITIAEFFNRAVESHCNKHRVYVSKESSAA